MNIKSIDDRPEDTDCRICGKETYDWIKNAMGDSILVNKECLVVTLDLDPNAELPPEERAEDHFEHGYFCSWQCLLIFAAREVNSEEK